MADIYWDPVSGNNSTGDGSSGNPYQTIAKCWTEADDGDNLIVPDGTYVLTASVASLVTTPSLSNITIRSESNDPTKCIIDGDGNSYYFAHEWNSTMTPTNCTISGMTFKDLGQRPNAWSMESAGSIIVENMIHENCQMGGGTFAFYSRTVGGSGGTYTVRNCIFNDAPTGYADYCILGSTNGPTPNGATFNFYNNSLYFTNGGPTNVGILYMNAAGPAFMNAFNNIYHNNTGQTLKFARTQQSHHTLSYTNNCFYAESGAITQTQGSWTLGDVDSNITTDPLYVSTDSGDFRLRPGSPCLDTGTVVT